MASSQPHSACGSNTGASAGVTSYFLQNIAGWSPVQLMHTVFVYQQSRESSRTSAQRGQS